MQLISTNYPGNLHAASDCITRDGLAAYVLTLDFSGSATVVVFRVPDSMGPKLRKHFGHIDHSNPPPSKTWD